MERLRQGDSAAAERLTEIFYGDLRRLAARKMRSEGPGHTLQPTALVNELFLELIKIKQLRSSVHGAGREKADFMALSAHIMHQLLIHHARPLRKQAVKLSLQEDDYTGTAEASLCELDDLLMKLGKVDSRLRTVVELKVFEGLSNQEIATRMNCALRTVARYWRYARAWLEENLITTGRRGNRRVPSAAGAAGCEPVKAL
jgi:RNA polymerase sigma factor (TIGR02999 family)